MSKQDERTRLLDENYESNSLAVNAADYRSIGDESEEEDTKPNFVHLEGGYGWLVCIATFWCFGVIIGMDYNYSLIYNKLVVVYNSTGNHVVYAGKFFFFTALLKK
jgi:hypothetical protein